MRRLCSRATVTQASRSRPARASDRPAPQGPSPSQPLRSARAAHRFENVELQIEPVRLFRIDGEADARVARRTRTAASAAAASPSARARASRYSSRGWIADSFTEIELRVKIVAAPLVLMRRDRRDRIAHRTARNARRRRRVSAASPSMSNEKRKPRFAASLPRFSASSIVRPSTNCPPMMRIAVFIA